MSAWESIVILYLVAFAVILLFFMLDPNVVAYDAEEYYT
jgi:hypothetical protein